MAPNAPLPLLPPRPKDCHKASVGRVLIVGGSRGMAGAPALCARGALRAGAGLVTIAVPALIADVVAGFLPEAMVIALPCDDDGALDSSADEAVLRHLDRVDALVVGPGLGRAPQHRGGRDRASSPRRRSPSSSTPTASTPCAVASRTSRRGWPRPS